jgi:hypothetical protein
MKDYLMLIVFPSETLDRLNGKKTGFLTLYLAVTLALAGLNLPKYIAASMNNPKGFETLGIQLIALTFVYFPFVYAIGYCYWIVCKGFKGLSSYLEIRTLVAYSMLPFVVQFVINVPFVAVGLLKNDVSIIAHDNYLSSLILWLLSFRITMVGIAKYNRFNWMITLFIYLIVATVLGGFAYLLLQLKR